MKNLIAFVTALSISAVGVADPVKEIENLFAGISSSDDPGCAVGVMRDGEIILRKGFGAANVAFGVPNNPSTAFEIASGSKTFTAACIALLMDQGKLKPTDDVRNILPELRLNRPVQIRHLLRCESGVWAQFHIMPLAGWDNVPVHSPYSKEDFFTVLCGQEILPFEPGSQFQYGSGDTFLLGMVVERISGQTLAEFAKQNLFEPLGMTRTWYLEDPALIVKNRAVGHWKSQATWASGKHSPATEWQHWNTTAFLGGGGSVLTTIDDMLKWATVYQGGKLPAGKYMDELTTEGTVLGNRFVLDVDGYMKHVNQHPDNPAMGTYRGLKRIQVTGGYWGFTCCVSHFPAQKVTVACLSNSDSVSAVGTARKISDILLAENLNAFPPAPEKAAFIDLPQDQLSRFAGTYRQKGNKPLLRVSVEESCLKVGTAFGEKATLRPISATRFRPDGKSPFYDSAVFEFTSTEDEVTGVTLATCEKGFHEIVPHHRVTEAAPYDIAALQKFAGTFVSRELGAIYRVRVKDKQLQLRVGSRRWEPMQPLEQEEFSPIVEDPHNTRFLRFTRTKDGAVDGFSIGFWRIHGVRFDRVDTP